MEIQFGVGGDDSKLFVKDLGEAYVKYAESNNLKCHTLLSESGKLILQISGQNALNLFKQESGKHILQRVPPTETKGRRQTSAVNVVLLPVLKENTFKLDLNNVEIQTQVGSGPGGQHRNKTESSVRAIHKPTGVQVYIDGRKQHQNKQKALQILQSKLYQIEQDKLDAQRNKKKKKQMGFEARSGKIRTYNFIHQRVTDHRSNKKTSNIKAVMNGCFEWMF